MKVKDLETCDQGLETMNAGCVRRCAASLRNASTDRITPNDNAMTRSLGRQTWVPLAVFQDWSHGHSACDVTRRRTRDA